MKSFSPTNIKNFSITNFKAFGTRQTIPIKPITLIFGANSSGKSSIIHSLLLFNHFVQTGMIDTHFTKLGGEAVDLGGFKNYVFRHENDRSVTFDISLDHTIKNEEWDVTTFETHRFDYSFTFDMHGPRVALRSVQVQVDGESYMTLGSRTDGDELAINTLNLQSWFQERNERLFKNLYSSHNHDDFEFDDLQKQKYEQRIFSTYLLKQIDLFAEEKSEMFAIQDDGNDRYAVFFVPLFDQEGGEFLDGLLEYSGLSGKELDSLIWYCVNAKNYEDDELPFEDEANIIDAYLKEIGTNKTFEEICQHIEVANSSVSTRIKQDFLHDLRDATLEPFEILKNCLNQISYLGPLRTFPPRILSNDFSDNPNWSSGGGFAWQRVKDDEKLRNNINRWLGDDKALKKPYRLEIQHLYSSQVIEETLKDSLSGFGLQNLNLILKPLIEVLLAQNMSLSEVNQIIRNILEKNSDSFAELREESEILKYLVDEEKAIEADEIDSTYDDLKQGLLESMGQIESSAEELMLFDTVTKTRVSHRDVGIGISQVLPVLANAYDHSGATKTVLIEQPELHLHPALQTELADVFIENAYWIRENQDSEDEDLDERRYIRKNFFIETHSEHLILRFMKRVRQSTDEDLPADKPHLYLRPEDISILFVEPKDGSSVVKHLRLDEDGQFLDPWPGGFFEESFKERF